MLHSDPEEVDDVVESPTVSSLPEEHPPAARRYDADSPVVERRVARALVALAALAVAAAVALNVLNAPPTLNVTAAKATALATRYEPGVPNLSKKPLQMLPSEVLAYETMARQASPGAPNRSAEAIYVTMNMNVEQQVSMSVYAHVEAFAADSDARVKQAEIMSGYSRDTSTIMLGTTVAKVGYSADQAAYGITWMSKGYVTFVKASFRDTPPARRREELLKAQADPVINAIEAYQRTGKEGIQIGAQQAAKGKRSKPATKTKDPNAPHLAAPQAGADW